MKGTVMATVTPRTYRVVRVYMPGLLEVEDIEIQSRLVYNAYTRQLSCSHCNARTPAYPVKDDPISAKEGALITLNTAMLTHNHKGDDAHDYR